MGFGGGKAKKKTWSKGKVLDKMNNKVLFDKSNYDKLYKEVTQYQLITTSVVSERLKIRGGQISNKNTYETVCESQSTINLY